MPVTHVDFTPAKYTPAEGFKSNPQQRVAATGLHKIIPTHWDKDGEPTTKAATELVILTDENAVPFITPGQLTALSAARAVLLDIEDIDDEDLTDQQMGEKIRAEAVVDRLGKLREENPK